MLELTPTESKIVEILKSGPKTGFELEQEIDRGKDFSNDYIKVMIHKINKKRRIIDSFYRDGQRVWQLIESEMNVEYQILSGVSELREDTLDIKEVLDDVDAEVRSTRIEVGWVGEKVDNVDIKVDSVRVRVNDVKTSMGQIHTDVKEVPYKAVAGVSVKVNWIIVALLAIIGGALFMAGYFMGISYWKVIIEISPEQIREMSAEASR